MLLVMKVKLAAAAMAVVAPIALTTLSPSSNGKPDPDVAELAPAEFSYRLAGDFSRDGRPVEAPSHKLTLPASLAIMKHQVTAADYGRCIDAGNCPRVALPRGRQDVPMVGISWHDAMAYAAWISTTTGVTHRLPTDEEWVFAAAEAARDEALPLVDPADPAQAWIARYEAESARSQTSEAAPQPVGSFGLNSNGLWDVAGNVWEWTDSCFIRATLDGPSMRVTNTNCGVRVVEGAHRTYMTDFIRDPRVGGCAAGVPPTNLGFRLVIETRRPAAVAMWHGWLRWMRRTG